MVPSLEVSYPIAFPMVLDGPAVDGPAGEDAAIRYHDVGVRGAADSEKGADNPPSTHVFQR